jgi:hypothetical protein
MYSLASGKLDPFVGLVGALSELQAGELGLFQVLWQRAHNPWAESIVRSVTHADGKSFFVNAPELAKAAGTKVSHPIYAAVVRVAARAETFERALQIACDMAGSLRVFANPQGNELIPLQNEIKDYSLSEHVEDMLQRQSRRCGMLLNSEELIGFVHLPSSAVRSPVLERDTGKTKAAPPIVHHKSGLLLGQNIHFGKEISVRLTPDQRVYHAHIIGATGTGKSTLLFNLIRQDIENGEGIAVFDPHGDLVDRILGVIPQDRIGDVVLVDPADDEFSIGFNILSAHSEHEKTLLASDLVSVFQRLSTSWGDQMQSVLQNAILAFLNSSRGGTIADLRRFLVETAFRNEFLKSVSDPNVLYYWHKGFEHLPANKSRGPVLTRLEMFLAHRPIAHMVSQAENRLDFGHIMDSGKIFLAKLPEGLLGRENSYLLGALIVSKFQQLVMARQAKKIAARRDFWIYIDEFANFITPTMAEILSEARKYRIGLTLAHHNLHQLQRDSEVASAVMTHPYTRVVFRVGDDDAKKLAEGFSFFEAADLKNLEPGQAICRVERSNFDFNLSVPLPEMPDEAEMAERQQAVITASRQTYGTPRAKVEAMLRQAWGVADASAQSSTAAAKAKPPPDEPPACPPGQPVVPKPPPVLPTAPVLPIASPAASAPAGTNATTPAADLSPAPPPIIPQSAEPPKPAEVPKNTGPEKKIAESAVAVKKSAGETAATRKLGRGGVGHQDLQVRLQAEARALGFLADVEKTLKPTSMQAADLVLERNNLLVAVEMVFTTGPGHELGNVKKCLAGGFSRVIVVCQDPDKLKKIEGFIQPKLSTESTGKVNYCVPDDFNAVLRRILAESDMESPPSETPGKQIVLGYEVTETVPELAPEEQQQREDIAHRVMADVMRQP